MDRQDIYAKLKECGIALPEIGAHAAAYVLCAQSGDIAYLSGHLARKDGKVWVGKLGATLTTEEGRTAARQVAIDLLATLHAHIGDLNRIIVPRSTSQVQTDEMVYLPISGDAPRAPISLAWRRHDRSPVVRRFLTVARRMARAWRKPPQ